MKVISATEVVTEINQVLEFEHEGDIYKWVGYQSEKWSDTDIYKNEKWLSPENYPDFIDELDLYELWDANFKGEKNENH